MHDHMLGWWRGVKAVAIAAVIALAGDTATATSLSASCAPDQISVLCPQTIVSGSSPTWSGTHTWLNNLLLTGTGIIYGQTTNSQLSLNNSVGAALGYNAGNGLSFVSDSNGAHIGSVNYLSVSGLTGFTGFGTTTPGQKVDVRGNIVGNSSVTASGFFGDGSGLAQVTAVRVPPSGVDLSTVTTALGGKLSNTAAVPTNLVDLSTVTTALDLKAPLASPTFTGIVTSPDYVGNSLSRSSLGSLAITAFSTPVQGQTGGSVDITAGASNAPNTGTGGAVNISGGATISNNFSGGAVNIFGGAGNGGNNSAGGSISILAGNGGGGGNGGDLNLHSGLSAGIRGNVNIGIIPASGLPYFRFTGLGALENILGAHIALTGANGYISTGSSATASGFFGNGSAMTGVVGYANAGGYSSTLGLGSTFFAFVSDENITLKRITATVVVPGAGGAGDTYRCQNSAGAGISVTVSAAAAAGSVTTATGTQAITSGSTVNGLLLTSSATTTPVVNVICEYSR